MDNVRENKYNTYDKKLIRTSQTKRIPDGIELYYGSAYIITTRDFMKWVMTDSIALNLINWSRDTYSPDEIIWATLSRIYQKQNITNAHSKKSSGGILNQLRPPSTSLGPNVSSNSQLKDYQLSYARAVKWEDKALKWIPPYPVCQGMFPLESFFSIIFSYIINILYKTEIFKYAAFYMRNY